MSQMRVPSSRRLDSTGLPDAPASRAFSGAPSTHWEASRYLARNGDSSRGTEPGCPSARELLVGTAPVAQVHIHRHRLPPSLGAWGPRRRPWGAPAHSSSSFASSAASSPRRSRGHCRQLPLVVVVVEHRVGVLLVLFFCFAAAERRHLLREGVFLASLQALCGFLRATEDSPPRRGRGSGSPDMLWRSLNCGEDRSSEGSAAVTGASLPENEFAASHACAVLGLLAPLSICCPCSSPRSPDPVPRSQAF